MQYFIGVVPPIEYSKQIVAFQYRWPSNILPMVVEPHITVKAQGGLDKDMAWVNKVREVCAAFPRFELQLLEPASFGSSVLFLGVQSMELVQLHRRLVFAVSPTPDLIQRYFEMDDYTPHLTLGQTDWGMDEADLSEMKSIANEQLAPFPTFTVKYIRIYQEVVPDKYMPYEDIVLG